MPSETANRIGKTLVIPLPNHKSTKQANSAVVMAGKNEDARQHHQVMSGETLWSIAQQYQVSISDLLHWNKLKIDMPLQLDQILLILK